VDPPQACLELLPSGLELIGCFALEWVEIDKDIFIVTGGTAIMEEMYSLEPHRFAICLHVLGLLFDEVLTAKGPFAVRAFSPHDRASWKRTLRPHNGVGGTAHLAGFRRYSVRA
jgi:hypothetical protein